MCTQAPTPRCAAEWAQSAQRKESGSQNTSAAQRALQQLVEAARPATAQQAAGNGCGAWRIRVSWQRPRANGYPIQHYVLEQREKALPPHRTRRSSVVDGALRPFAPLDDEATEQEDDVGFFPRSVDEAGEKRRTARRRSSASCAEGRDEREEAQWTPWHEATTAHPTLAECCVRAPARDAAAVGTPAWQDT